MAPESAPLLQQRRVDTAPLLAHRIHHHCHRRQRPPSRRARTPPVAPSRRSRTARRQNSLQQETADHLRIGKGQLFQPRLQR